MQADGLTLDQTRLEGLDTQTVQRRSTVQQYRVPLQDVLKDFVHHRILAIDNLLGGLHRLHNTSFENLADDKRLEQLGSHIFRQTALVEVQVGTDNDNRTARVVNTFTQQVLTETTLLTFQTVGKGLEGAVGLRLHGARLLGVVEQGIDGLLKHTLLITHNHVRSLDFDKAFETVVADDDTTVEVVEVGGGETAAIQRDQRTQLGRDDRDDFDNHPFRSVFRTLTAVAESLEHVQTLQQIFLTLLGGLTVGAVAQLV